MSEFPQVLTVAGSDSGGGAGIQADLKTFQMRQVFGTSVITAITAQNTMSVYDICTIAPTTVESQLKAIAEDFNIAAFKIGMLGTAEIIECVANALQRYDFGKMVLDPVMIAKGGAPLLAPNAVAALKRYLIPAADVITPNIPETQAITGVPVTDERSARQAARILQALGAKTVVIKGGHAAQAQSAVCIDRIFSPQGDFSVQGPRFDTPHTHGTGCTFSACITAELAKGNGIEQSIRMAKDFITQAISHPLNIGHGHGPTNHWAYAEFKTE